MSIEQYVSDIDTRRSINDIQDFDFIFGQVQIDCNPSSWIRTLNFDDITVPIIFRLDQFITDLVTDIIDFCVLSTEEVDLLPLEINFFDYDTESDDELDAWHPAKRSILSSSLNLSPMWQPSPLKSNSSELQVFLTPPSPGITPGQVVLPLNIDEYVSIQDYIDSDLEYESECEEKDYEPEEIKEIEIIEPEVTTLARSDAEFFNLIDTDSEADSDDDDYYRNMHVFNGVQDGTFWTYEIELQDEEDWFNPDCETGCVYECIAPYFRGDINISRQLNNGIVTPSMFHGLAEQCFDCCNDNMSIVLLNTHGDCICETHPNRSEKIILKESGNNHVMRLNGDCIGEMQVEQIEANLTFEECFDMSQNFDSCVENGLFWAGKSKEPNSGLPNREVHESKETEEEELGLKNMSDCPLSFEKMPNGIKCRAIYVDHVEKSKMKLIVRAKKSLYEDFLLNNNIIKITGVKKVKKVKTVKVKTTKPKSNKRKLKSKKLKTLALTFDEIVCSENEHEEDEKEDVVITFDKVSPGEKIIVPVTFDDMIPRQEVVVPEFVTPTLFVVDTNCLPHIFQKVPTWRQLKDIEMRHVPRNCRIGNSWPKAKWIEMLEDWNIIKIYKIIKEKKVRVVRPKVSRPKVMKRRKQVVIKPTVVRHVEKLENETTEQRVYRHKVHRENHRRHRRHKNKGRKVKVVKKVKQYHEIPYPVVDMFCPKNFKIEESTEPRWFENVEDTGHHWTKDLVDQVVIEFDEPESIDFEIPEFERQVASKIRRQLFPEPEPEVVVPEHLSLDDLLAYVSGSDSETETDLCEEQMPMPFVEPQVEIEVEVPSGLLGGGETEYHWGVSLNTQTIAEQYNLDNNFTPWIVNKAKSGCVIHCLSQYITSSIEEELIVKKYHTVHDIMTLADSCSKHGEKVSIVMFGANLKFLWQTHSNRREKICLLETTIGHVSLMKPAYCEKWRSQEDPLDHPFIVLPRLYNIEGDIIVYATDEYFISKGLVWAGDLEKLDLEQWEVQSQDLISDLDMDLCLTLFGEVDCEETCVSVQSNWSNYIEPNSSNGFCVSRALGRYLKCSGFPIYKTTFLELIDLADLCEKDNNQVSICLISGSGRRICQTHPDRSTKLVLSVNGFHCNLVTGGFTVRGGHGKSVNEYIGDTMNLHAWETDLLTRSELLDQGLWLGMEEEQEDWANMSDSEPLTFSPLPKQMIGTPLRLRGGGKKKKLSSKKRPKLDLAVDEPEKSKMLPGRAAAMFEAARAIEDQAGLVRDNKIKETNDEKAKRIGDRIQARRLAKAAKESERIKNRKTKDVEKAVESKARKERQEIRKRENRISRKAEQMRKAEVIELRRTPSPKRRRRQSTPKTKTPVRRRKSSIDVEIPGSAIEEKDHPIIMKWKAGDIGNHEVEDIKKYIDNRYFKRKTFLRKKLRQNGWTQEEINRMELKIETAPPTKLGRQFRDSEQRLGEMEETERQISLTKVTKKVNTKLRAKALVRDRPEERSVSPVGSPVRHKTSKIREVWRKLQEKSTNKGLNDFIKEFIPLNKRGDIKTTQKKGVKLISIGKFMRKRKTEKKEVHAKRVEKRQRKQDEPTETGRDVIEVKEPEEVIVPRESEKIIQFPFTIGGPKPTAKTQDERNSNKFVVDTMLQGKHEFSAAIAGGNRALESFIKKWMGSKAKGQIHLKNSTKAEKIKFISKAFGHPIPPSMLPSISRDRAEQALRDDDIIRANNNDKSAADRRKKKGLEANRRAFNKRKDTIPTPGSPEFTIPIPESKEEEKAEQLFIPRSTLPIQDPSLPLPLPGITPGEPVKSRPTVVADPDAPVPIPKKPLALQDPADQGKVRRKPKPVTPKPAFSPPKPKKINKRRLKIKAQLEKLELAKEPDVADAFNIPSPVKGPKPKALVADDLFADEASDDEEEMAAIDKAHKEKERLAKAAAQRKEARVILGEDGELLAPLDGAPQGIDFGALLDQHEAEEKEARLNDDFEAILEKDLIDPVQKEINRMNRRTFSKTQTEIIKKKAKGKIFVPQNVGDPRRAPVLQYWDLLKAASSGDVKIVPITEYLEDMFNKIEGRNVKSTTTLDDLRKDDAKSKKQINLGRDTKRKLEWIKNASDETVQNMVTTTADIITSDSIINNQIARRLRRIVAMFRADPDDWIKTVTDLLKPAPVTPRPAPSIEDIPEFAGPGEKVDEPAKSDLEVRMDRLRKAQTKLRALVGRRKQVDTGGPAQIAVTGEVFVPERNEDLEREIKAQKRVVKNIKRNKPEADARLETTPPRKQVRPLREPVIEAGPKKVPSMPIEIARGSKADRIQWKLTQDIPLTDSESAFVNKGKDKVPDQVRPALVQNIPEREDARTVLLKKAKSGRIAFMTIQDAPTPRELNEFMDKWIPNENDRVISRFNEITKITKGSTKTNKLKMIREFLKRIDAQQAGDERAAQKELAIQEREKPGGGSKMKWYRIYENTLGIGRKRHSIEFFQGKGPIRVIVERELNIEPKVIILGANKEMRKEWEEIVESKDNKQIDQFIENNIPLRKRTLLKTNADGDVVTVAVKKSTSSGADKVRLVEDFLDREEPNTDKVKGEIMVRKVNGLKNSRNGGTIAEWYTLYSRLLTSKQRRIPAKDFDLNELKRVVENLVRGGERDKKNTRALFPGRKKPLMNDEQFDLIPESGATPQRKAAPDFERTFEQNNPMDFAEFELSPSKLNMFTPKKALRKLKIAGKDLDSPKTPDLRVKNFKRPVRKGLREQEVFMGNSNVRFLPSPLSPKLPDHIFLKNWPIRIQTNVARLAEVRGEPLEKTWRAVADISGRTGRSVSDLLEMKDPLNPPGLRDHVILNPFAGVDFADEILPRTPKRERRKSVRFDPEEKEFEFEPELPPLPLTPPTPVKRKPRTPKVLPKAILDQVELRKPDSKKNEKLTQGEFVQPKPKSKFVKGKPILDMFDPVVKPTKEESEFKIKNPKKIPNAPARLKPRRESQDFNGIASIEGNIRPHIPGAKQDMKSLMSKSKLELLTKRDLGAFDDPFDAKDEERFFKNQSRITPADLVDPVKRDITQGEFVDPVKRFEKKINSVERIQEAFDLSRDKAIRKVNSVDPDVIKKDMIKKETNVSRLATKYNRTESEVKSDIRSKAILLGKTKAELFEMDDPLSLPDPAEFNTLSELVAEFGATDSSDAALQAAKQRHTVATDMGVESEADLKWYKQLLARILKLKK